MHKILRTFLTLFLFSCFTISSLPAQNIGKDLSRIVRLTPEARTIGTPDNNQALDTIVLTLAYYGGMPHEERIQDLLTGTNLLAHFAGNHAIRTYLLNEKLDRLLEQYEPTDGLSIPAFINPAARSAFLRKLPGAELFSRNGEIDLGKIHEVFSAPPNTSQSLKA
ncbi:MAG: hypothetical protein AAF840_04635, partial [Bacteroidota bacterium]